MNRLALGNTSAPPAQHEPQFRNPQFRRPQNQQRPRENRNQQLDPPVRPPFQQNLVDEDVKLRLFAQSFTGEVRKWFKALTPGSIHNWNEFEDNFLRK